MKFKFETEVKITDGFYEGKIGEIAYLAPLFFIFRTYHVFIDRLPGSHRDVCVNEKHLKQVTLSKEKAKQ